MKVFVKPASMEANPFPVVVTPGFCVPCVVKENWPEAYNRANGDQDLIDASAINRYGYQHVRLTQAIIKKAQSGKKDRS